MVGWDRGKEAVTSDVILVGREGLDGTEETNPVLLKEIRVGDDLPVSLNLALAGMVVNGNIEAIGNVELDDEQEPAERPSHLLAPLLCLLRIEGLHHYRMKCMERPSECMSWRFSVKTTKAVARTS